MLSFMAICSMYNYLIIASVYVHGNLFSSVPALRDYCVCIYDLIFLVILTKSPSPVLLSSTCGTVQKVGMQKVAQ
jgi:NADH:ubiquinone oxidoreductase subunit H